MFVIYFLLKKKKKFGFWVVREKQAMHLFGRHNIFTLTQVWLSATLFITAQNALAEN